MIRTSGWIISRKSCPFIYFIKKSYFIYIGETQSNPIKRWNRHLDPSGSFSQALKKRDEEIYNDDMEIFFLAYNCPTIELSVPPAERRRVTQFVEHELHVRVICNDGKLGEPLELISDTTRTAPLYCRYEWVHQVIDEIFEAFLIDVNKITKILTTEE